ncbi:MAG: hypothetical protein ACFFED_11975 [Candidatus Thorarchaeota archaeon]
MSESLNLQWMLPSSFAAAWGISFALQQSIEGLVLSIAGMASLLVAIYAYTRVDSGIKLYWDDSRHVLSIIRRWKVEVTALRLFQSVPLGIDLSHSANKVLSSMRSRYQGEPDGTLQWVVCRPLGSSKTRVGFMVSRQGTRLPTGIRRMELLSDMVLEDAFVLESAMRAAYPHTPIVDASVEDIELIRRGGIEPIETVS